ncbi:MAG: HD-GYP domain-containing protein, partial [Armatimonadetes bacterium]|nr:HD-GYP domain-containing protein [Armatimonadota bacterium]
MSLVSSVTPEQRTGALVFSGIAVILSFVPALSEGESIYLDPSPILGFAALVPFGAKGAILTALLASVIVQLRFFISGVIPRSRWRISLINVTIVTVATLAGAAVFYLGAKLPMSFVKLPAIGFGMCAAAMAASVLYRTILHIVEFELSPQEAFRVAWKLAILPGAWFANLGGFLAGMVLHFQPAAIPVIILLFVLDHWVDWAYAAVRREFYQAVVMVSQALESRDEYTERHSEGVAEITRILALRMGQGEWRAEEMRVAAMLHDLGKILTPDDVLFKPDKLSPDERKTMEQHASNLREVLGDPEFLEEKVQWAASHHEKWDGTGYPKGLKGESIPLPSRIMAVADVWNALTTDRPYRKGMPREKAVRIIEEG